MYPAASHCNAFVDRAAGQCTIHRGRLLKAAAPGAPAPACMHSGTANPWGAHPSCWSAPAAPRRPPRTHRRRRCTSAASSPAPIAAAAKGGKEAGAGGGGGFSCRQLWFGDPGISIRVQRRHPVASPHHPPGRRCGRWSRRWGPGWRRHPPHPGTGCPACASHSHSARHGAAHSSAVSHVMHESRRRRSAAWLPPHETGQPRPQSPQSPPPHPCTHPATHLSCCEVP